MDWLPSVLILPAIALSGCAGTGGEPTVLHRAPHYHTVADPVTGTVERRAFVDVTFDAGGKVRLYDDATEAMLQNEIEIRIDGICLSACTMYLPVACVTPDATLGFHRPKSTVAPMTPRRFDEWSAMMAEHYPPAIAAWWMQTARYAVDPVYLTGAQAIALGARQCPPGAG